MPCSSRFKSANFGPPGSVVSALRVGKSLLIVWLRRPKCEVSNMVLNRLLRIGANCCPTVGLRLWSGMLTWAGLFGGTGGLHHDPRIVLPIPIAIVPLVASVPLVPMAFSSVSRSLSEFIARVRCLCAAEKRGRSVGNEAQRMPTLTSTMLQIWIGTIAKKGSFEMV